MLKVKFKKSMTCQQYVNAYAQLSDLFTRYHIDEYEIIYEFSLLYEDHRWRVRKRQNELPPFFEIPELIKHIEQLPLDQLQFSDLTCGKKYAVQQVYKQSGGRFKQTNCCHWCCTSFQKRSVIITPQGVIILKGKLVREMLLYDYSFTVYPEAKLKIKLSTATRQLTVQCSDIYSYIDLLVQIKKAYQKSESTKLHRYDSFAPNRMSNQGQVFVDGEEYYSNLYEELTKAKSEVFITDWWLSPQLYLKRPAKEEYRLDVILGQLGTRGVKILIIVYNEPKLALTINSKYTQDYLCSLSPNIVILRHPKSVIPVIWSHHEKLVVIDQTVGYIGGLDLCYGRFDNQEHALFDDNEVMFPGCDYSNSRICDFRNVINYQKCDIDRKKLPRMPWHDIHVKLVGGVVQDMAKHFIQYWNFVCIDLKRKEQLLLLEQQKPNLITQYKDKVIKWSQQVGEFIRDKINKKQEEDTPLEIEIPRMSRRGRSFSLNSARQIDSKRRVSFEVSKYNTFLESQAQDNNNGLNLLQKISITEDPLYLFPEYGKQSDPIQESELPSMDLNILFHPQQKQANGTISAQILRSASTWSLGLNKLHTEYSIQIAYIQLIAQSKKHIYIENQFFMSSTGGAIIQNQISQALVQRIKQAHKLHEQFHCLMVLPLLPGFEGEIDSDTSNVMRIQLHYEYNTIARGGNSMIQQLSHIQNLSDYLTIVGLRAHGVNSEGEPKTEMIYVHSKMMIVDDKYIICGSANINDRSLKGTRDSEIAVLLEDQQIVQDDIRRLAYDLRRKLYEEHFHITGFYDPNDLEIIHKIQQQAEQNTRLYRAIFACYPDDTVRNYRDLQVFRKRGNLKEYFSLSNQIKGNAVQWPLEFLSEESLKLPVFAMEQIVPDINFT